MSRLPSPKLAACLGVLIAAWLTGPAPAQDAAADAIADDSPDGVIESYLQARELDALLAEHLRARLEEASGAHRVEIAERLGRVYARLLSDARTGSDRDDLTRASGALLEEVPGADTFDLRIALTKARYLIAERSAERARLGLADDAEIREAVEAFGSIAEELVLLGGRADRRVGALERRERSGGVSDLFSLRADLAEARRQRSLAKYYAGWALYYLGLLNDSPGSAVEALAEFGHLLGASGAEPTLDKLPRSLLRYEHVARAAMGVALCHSLLGDHVSAVMWLRELEKSEDAHAGVSAQLFTRKVTVLSGAKRWDTLSRAVERRRGAGLDEKAKTPLEINEARLLAVAVLGAIRAPDADGARRDAAEPIVRAALSDLIARGSSAQVLDLVERYGTLPLGDNGFIGRYVRGLRAYRAAREAHAAAGVDETRPTREAALVAAYLDAADLLAHAFESDDADSFREEQTAAGMMLGMALYYKDSPAMASERFAAAADLAPDGAKRAEAQWMSIVALERAIEQGRADLQSRLHAAAVVYVETFPGDDRSARLLLRFAGSGLFGREASLSVLLGVSRESPLYTAARRHAADVLYRSYAGASEPGRSELAGRFIPVAFELIEPILRAVRSGESPSDAGQADRAVLRIRQVLDAALTPFAADAESARRALAVLEELRVRTGHRVDNELAGELAYRRLQYAFAVGDTDGQRSAHRELETIGGRFLVAADRFLFSRALERWRRSREAADAVRVVEIGTRLIGDGEIARPMLSTADACARAATALWESRADHNMLTIALDLDRRVRGAFAPTAELLRRLAGNAEARGDHNLAFEVWTQLSASIPAGGADWFEARHGVFRALAVTHPAEALAAMRQHRLLYPRLGPSPWNERFAELERRLDRDAGEDGP